MIEVTNLTKSFGDKRVLSSFSASFDVGATCLMGKSGAGKTTIANIVLGLIKADDGEIRGVDGRRVSCVFQENRLIEELSAYKNLMLVCESDCSEKVQELLSEMGLGDSIKAPVSTLSGGMKRRVAIARALITPADIYIFDEPFEGLDDARKDEVIAIIKRYTEGKVSIFITHDIADAKAMGAKLVEVPLIF